MKNSALKILVVDDDLDILKFLSIILKTQVILYSLLTMEYKQLKNLNSYFCLKIFFGK